MSKWISTEDRLPESGRLVLVCNSNVIDCWQTVAHWNEFEKWWQRGIEELPWKVTHWQPLPEPPK